jgi:hypothetical protein
MLESPKLEIGHRLPPPSRKRCGRDAEAVEGNFVIKRDSRSGDWPWTKSPPPSRPGGTVGCFWLLTAVHESESIKAPYNSDVSQQAILPGSFWCRHCAGPRNTSNERLSTTTALHALAIVAVPLTIDRCLLGLQACIYPRRTRSVRCNCAPKIPRVNGCLNPSLWPYAAKAASYSALDPRVLLQGACFSQDYLVNCLAPRHSSASAREPLAVYSLF